MVASSAQVKTLVCAGGQLRADSRLERGQPCPRVPGFRSSSRGQGCPRSCLAVARIRPGQFRNGSAVEAAPARTCRVQPGPTGSPGREQWRTVQFGRRAAGMCFIRAPVLRFSSAPAERSGDGALDSGTRQVLTQGSGLARAPNPKRRGVSLPAALPKWARPATRAGPISEVGWERAKHIHLPTEARRRRALPDFGN
jgi:hypothetical protein